MIWRILSALMRKSRMLWWHIVYKGYCSQYSIAKTFRFNGTGIQLYGAGDIKLAEASYIGELSTLQSGPGLSIAVGRNCAISHNVRMYTLSAVADADFRSGPVPQVAGSISIGDGVWIGANCFIGPGVRIGNNAVLGANSVVTKSIPENEIWGGVPAKLIRQKRTKAPETTDGT